MMPILRPKATAVLSAATRKDLSRRQKTASGYAAGEKRITNAWKRFSGTAARTDVETQLDDVFDSKCAYCETILPKDIEHFYPKSRFPRRMFRWENFLRACKNCNTEKLDDFPLRRGGAPVLLDPCKDEPTEFFTWNLDTGMPVLTTDPARHVRADKTVSMFELDNQQYCDERRARALHFEFILLQSIEKSPIPPNVHTWLLDELKATRPYRSVLRQIVRDPSRRRLIARVKRAVPAAAPLLAALEV